MFSHLKFQFTEYFYPLQTHPSHFQRFILFSTKSQHNCFRTFLLPFQPFQVPLRFQASKTPSFPPNVPPEITQPSEFLFRDIFIQFCHFPHVSCLFHPIPSVHRTKQVEHRDMPKLFHVQRKSALCGISPRDALVDASRRVWDAIVRFFQGSVKLCRRERRRRLWLQPWPEYAVENTVTISIGSVHFRAVEHFLVNLRLISRWKGHLECFWVAKELLDKWPQLTVHSGSEDDIEIYQCHFWDILFFVQYKKKIQKYE